MLYINYVFVSIMYKPMYFFPVMESPFTVEALQSPCTHTADLLSSSTCFYVLTPLGMPFGSYNKHNAELQQADPGTKDIG